MSATPDAVDALLARSSGHAAFLLTLGTLAPGPVPLSAWTAAAVNLPPPLAGGDFAAWTEDASAAGVATVEGGETTLDPAAHRHLRAAVRTAAPELRRGAAGAAATVAAMAIPRDPEGPGQPAEMERWAPHALAAAEAAATEDVALDAAGFALGQVGRWLLARGDAAGAKPLLRRAVALRERAVGEGHLAVGFTLVYLNGALALLEEREEMVPIARRILAIFEAGAGPDDPATVTHANNLGAVLKRAGDVEGAVDAFRTAVERGARTFGQGHPMFATMASNLGEALFDLGRTDEAIPHLELALAVDRRHYAETNASVARDLNKLGRAHAAGGGRDRARALLAEALAFYEANLPAGHPHLAALRGEVAALGEAS